MLYGWKLGCRIFCGQFNQDVIWGSDPWHVWVESKSMKNCSTCYAHIDGASMYNWTALWRMLLKATIDNLLVATNEIWCNLHELSKMTCFDL
jgi:hypothetical protein